MKKLVTLLMLIIAFGGAITKNYAKGRNVEVISTKLDVFYFKVSKEFVGATIEVISPTGEVILTEKVMHRKALLDFYMRDPGTYTIWMKKDGVEEKFSYQKTNSSPLVPMAIDSLKEVISLIQ